MDFIAGRHQDVFLSEVMLERRSENVRWCFFTDNDDSDMRASGHPIDRIDPALLLEWVNADPGTRARPLAQVLTFAAGSSGGEEMNWTQPALDLIAIEETALEVLQEFERRVYLGSWTGSEAHRYARRLPLWEALQDHSNPNVRRWAREALQRLEHAIRSAEDRERGESQSFE